MSEGEFRAEMRYRMSLAVARAMLEEGAITKEEYSEIDTILLQKHRPILGTFVICQNICHKYDLSVKRYVMWWDKVGNPELSRV